MAHACFPGCAGRAAGNHNAQKIKVCDSLFGGKSGQKARPYSGEAGRVFAQEHGLRGKFFCENFHEGAFMSGPGGHVGYGLMCCGGHTPDGGNVLCAGAQAEFMGAAEDDGGGHNALTHIQRARAPGAVEFMGGNGEHVGLYFSNVNGNVSEGLHRVAVEGNSGSAGDFADDFHGLDDAGFIVGHLHAYERSVRADGLFNVGRGDETIFVGLYVCDLAFHAPGGFQNGGMLHGGNYHMLSPGGVHGEVVGLGAAGGEDYFVCACAHGLCNGSAGHAQLLSGRARRVVNRGRIVPCIAHALLHGPYRGLAGRGGGGMIKIYHDKNTSVAIDRNPILP